MVAFANGVGGKLIFGVQDNTLEVVGFQKEEINGKSAFSYMSVIEAWGSGIPRMFHEAKEYDLREPERIDMGSDFRVRICIE